MTNENQIRLKVNGESFWAYRYPDLPDNQAEINNHLLTDAYAFGDRVEFDEDRNVIRLVQTRADVLREMGGEMTNEKTTGETITVSREKLKRLVEIAKSGTEVRYRADGFSETIQERDRGVIWHT